MSDLDFIPRWASPPGDTIKDALGEQGLEQRWLAAALELTEEEFDVFLKGDTPLTIRLANRLCSTIGGSLEFWMTRDSQYREDRSRVAADAWAQRMPIEDMANLGWISPEVGNWVEQIDACLRFFDVESPEVWEADHEALVERARFRASHTIDPDGFALTAWLRQCEVELSEIPCREWDRRAFAALLPELLPLTREADPGRFLPVLRAKCASVGVAVGVVRAPSGCAVSGAARKLANGQPSIALSGRHLSDDHLWFTFFHETAHLLLHGTDGVYVDQIERDSESTRPAEEAEADGYAGRLLVPAEYEGRLVRARHAPLEIQDLAREVGVGRGILVGQLQHRGLLGYGTKFNKLKRRYKWNGPSLEKA
jgi:HTH-type transcriptional regulator/antitoxin HigA